MTKEEMLLKEENETKEVSEEELNMVTGGEAITAGKPGGSSTIRVRGIGTIGKVDPLYIIDGVQVEGIDVLNPSEIESIDVLKDAASTAIYGSKDPNK